MTTMHMLVCRLGEPARFHTRRPGLIASVAHNARQAVRRLFGQTTDWDLWRESAGGDAAAAAELVRRLTPMALSLARQMLGRTEDAEDAVQEAFLRLWGSSADDNHGAQLSTYFNTIVLNRCRTQLMRRRELSTEPEILAGMQDAMQLAEPVAAVDARQTQALCAAMQQLPARQRMALALWAYADADAEDIGRALDLDANATHQLLFRARRNLRRHWQEDQP